MDRSTTTQATTSTAEESPWRRGRAAGARWLAMHPRVLRAIKTAVAASLAWLCVRQLEGTFGGFLADYPYYAPLGAVVAVTSTVARSAREGGQAVLAVSMGAALALAARALDLPVWLALSLVVGVGTLLSGVPQVRDLGSWVPVSGLFVLLVGARDPVHYPVAYLALTAMGATIGVAVNLAVPPLPLLRTERSERRLRELLADQLDDLADGLLCDEELTEEDWARRRRDLLPATRQLETVMAELTEARRANWRLARWRESTDRQHEQARALHQLATLVDDVTSLVVHRGHLLRGMQEGSLVVPAGNALRSMAGLLRSLEGPTGEREELEEVDARVQELATAIRDHEAGSRRDGFAAASIVTSVRRALASLTPEELGDRIPSRW